ncbi:MAG: hypothetical protein AB8E15_12125 [Bdellovibrionales bacterium]
MKLFMAPLALLVSLNLSAEKAPFLDKKIPSKDTRNQIENILKYLPLVEGQFHYINEGKPMVRVMEGEDQKTDLGARLSIQMEPIANRILNYKIAENVLSSDTAFEVVNPFPWIDSYNQGAFDILMLRDSHIMGETINIDSFEKDGSIISDVNFQAVVNVGFKLKDEVKDDDGNIIGFSDDSTQFFARETIKVLMSVSLLAIDGYVVNVYSSPGAYQFTNGLEWASAGVSHVLKYVANYDQVLGDKPVEKVGLDKIDSTFIYQIVVPMVNDYVGHQLKELPSIPNLVLP